MHAKAIHWFRRDLRISDNTALRRASEQSEAVIPVYVVSPWEGRHLWTGAVRQKFLCGCLESLEKNLETVGGRLVYRRGEAVAELRRLIEETGAEAVFFNRDPDPFGRRCEERLAVACKEMGVVCHGLQDVVLHGPGDLLTGEGAPYRVYTPYYRRWIETDKPAPVRKPRDLATPGGIDSLARPTLETWKLAPGGAETLEPGERAARRRLQTALSDRLREYAQQRDAPAAGATSRLSQDLRFGTISIRTVFADTREAWEAARGTPRDSFAKFIAELAWREFYMQILAHFPQVLEVEFNPGWRGLPWDEPGGQFERWKRGETGFPIVDAGMRELAATGYMHNRVRMVVAMFLTKDLHLDWRLGEQFFMQSLVDGEIASNNGGWQWSAGTGADAAPYFRIQNPWTQGKRHDPAGAYIRKWVPELADAPAKALHDPPPSGDAAWRGYPEPLVDHAAERARTLGIFKRHASQRAS